MEIPLFTFGYTGKVNTYSIHLISHIKQLSATRETSNKYCVNIISAEQLNTKIKLVEQMMIVRLSINEN